MSKRTLVNFIDTWGDPIWIDADKIESISDFDDNRIKSRARLITTDSGMRHSVADDRADIVKAIEAARRS